MTSRTNVRPRPLELSKQLPIVRELSELDPPTEGAKDVVHTVEVRRRESSHVLPAPNENQKSLATVLYTAKCSPQNDFNK